MADEKEVYEFKKGETYHLDDLLVMTTKFDNDCYKPAPEMNGEIDPDGDMKKIIKNVRITVEYPKYFRKKVGGKV